MSQFMTYQTTGRGSVTSGVLVPNLDTAMAYIRAMHVTDAVTQQYRDDALQILWQLRKLAELEDQGAA